MPTAMHDVESSSGLKTFYSKDGMRSYIKALIEYYQHEADRYGESLGKLIRTPQQEAASPKDKGARKDQKEKGGDKPLSKGWSRMGQMLVNSIDPNVGITEVLFVALEEFKRRVSQTSEALKSLDGIEALGIPEGASYLLYLSDGVPSRLVIDAQKAKPQQFVFSADFQVV